MGLYYKVLSKEEIHVLMKENQHVFFLQLLSEGQDKIAWLVREQYLRYHNQSRILFKIQHYYDIIKTNSSGFFMSSLYPSIERIPEGSCTLP